MQAIFKRSEKKYLLTLEQCQQFYDKVKNYIEEDQYDDYTIYNLYYDTNQYDLIRHSIEKPPYKEKLRLRCYEAAHDDTSVFIELKKKYNSTVYKRRVSCTLLEAERLLNHHIPLPDQQQIVNEINYFLSFYQPAPKLFLSYHRRAFHGKKEKELRITLDSNIRYRTQNLSLKSQKEDQCYFNNHEILMEIKTSSAFPLWMTHILSELALYPVSFSKYGKIYTNCLFATHQKEVTHV